jgi:hypothetical protein
MWCGVQIIKVHYAVLSILLASPSSAPVSDTFVLCEIWHSHGSDNEHYFWYVTPCSLLERNLSTRLHRITSQEIVICALFMYQVKQAVTSQIDFSVFSLVIIIILFHGVCIGY